MRLNALQRLLENLYRIEVGFAVEDFLITDAGLARDLEGKDACRDAKEKLLVSQTGDQVELSLYLDADVVARLSGDNPLDCLHGGNFEDFLLALEGVSHFLYLLWNAGGARGVSLLELEMQAEVDKFVVAFVLFNAQRSGAATLQLWRCLFGAVIFDRQLSAEEHHRYRNASRYAGQFCSLLEHRYLRRDRKSEMLAEARRFYRLPQTEKLSLIHSA
jgi:hypothetical protein